MIKEEKSAKSKTYFIYFLLVIALSLFLISWLSGSRDVLKIEKIPVKIKITNVSGLAVENETLNLGNVIYGSSSKKTFEVTNNYGGRIVLELSCEGNISEFLIFEEYVYIEPNETKSVSVSSIVFSNETYGEYSGILEVKFKGAPE